MTALIHPLADRVSDEDLMTTAEVVAVTRAPVSTVRYWRHIG